MKFFKQNKLAIWGISFTIALPVAFIFFYLLLYILITRTGSEILFLNATSNRLDSERFFSTSEAIDTNFEEELKEGIIGFDDILLQAEIENNNQIIWPFMERHQNEIISIALSNKEYMQYLHDNDISLEDLKTYISERAHFNDYLYLTSLYFTFLLISFVTLWVFDYRKGFYIVSFIVYIWASISFFSNGIGDYLLTKPLALISGLFKSSFTNEDTVFLRTYLLNTLKEALLTIVLIDTVREMVLGGLSTSNIKCIRNTFRTLEIQINHLEGKSIKSSKFIGRLIIPSQGIEKKYKKSNQELVQILSFLRNNKNEIYTCEEYISAMKKALELMIESGLNNI